MDASVLYSTRHVSWIAEGISKRVHDFWYEGASKVDMIDSGLRQPAPPFLTLHLPRLFLSPFPFRYCAVQYSYRLLATVILGGIGTPLPLCVRQSTRRFQLYPAGAGGRPGLDGNRDPQTSDGFWVVSG